MKQNVRSFYQEKAEVLWAEAAALRRRTRSFVVAELVSFISAIAFTVAYALTDWGWPLLVMVAVMALVYLWIRSSDVRSSARLEECESWLAVYEGELTSLDNDFSHFDDGLRYVDAKHEFTLDLDIFGPESLYHRMNRTITTGGSKHLATLLAETRIPLVEEVSQRREAISKLAEKEVERTAFMAEGKKGHIDTEAVLQALVDMEKVRIPDFSASTFVLILALVMLAGFYALLICAILGFVGAGAVMAWALLEVLIACLLCARPLRVVGRVAGGVLRQLKIYGKLVELAKVPETKDAFSSLTSIVASIDRRNEFWIFFSNTFFLADIFIVRRFIKWKQRYMMHIPEWIDAVSSYDALVSLATFRFNHPEASDADIMDGKAIVFEAQGLWHPFLGTKAIRNDFRLDDSHYYIITGANMAGKSTFLRAVGINILLARIGLPVFAEHLRLSLFALFSSMRTTDDLQHGISYFNAELLRLQQLLQVVKKNACTLIILDEILRGTNSLDKLNGSRLFLETIAAQPVTGLIATHDLELSRMAEEYPDRFHNFCFEIQLDDAITYSYRLTPGVARNQNATHLLRQLLSTANI